MQIEVNEWSTDTDVKEVSYFSYAAYQVMSLLWVNESLQSIDEFAEEVTSVIENAVTNMNKAIQKDSGNEWESVDNMNQFIQLAAILGIDLENDATYMQSLRAIAMIRRSVLYKVETSTLIY